MHPSIRTLIAALLAASLRVCAEPAALPQRWIYLQTNLLVDPNVERDIALMQRTALEGYNGVVVTDTKFMRWDDLPPRYLQNVQRFVAACRTFKMQVIAGVMPIGYSEGLLAHDPNLAEGLPVSNATFVVRGGRLVPDDPAVAVVNGGFEQAKGNVPTGWRFVDQPGKIAWIDTEVKFQGRASLRMQDIGRFDPQNGHGRACQTLRVQPFHYYHVSVAIKTKDWVSPDTRILVLGGGRDLNYHMPALERTQDWKVAHATFNSLDASEVNLYLGVWGGKGNGTIWWDDLCVESAGFVNVVRRGGAPLTLTSEDGSTTYMEGRDFGPVMDAKLGAVPWPGSYSVWHEPPTVAVPAGSRLKEGQRVRASYYHAVIIGEGQVMCCMSEPKVYDILAWQIERVRDAVHPDAYLLEHDEIRVQGWDASCAKRGLTPAQILADNVRKCTDILRKADGGKPVYVWSDMFDPYHNAGPKGTYYLVKGDGPWYGSWAGLSADVGILNWHGHAEGRLESLKHFAGRGERQILAGYYDSDPNRIVGWLKDAAGVKGIEGVMYTTWRSDFGQTRAFLKAATGSDSP